MSTSAVGPKVGDAEILSFPNRGTPRYEAHRRRLVRATLVDARAWLTAGLEGSVPLEVAITEAYIGMGPAVRASLDSSLG